MTNIFEECLIGSDIINYEMVLLRKSDFMTSKERTYNVWKKFPYVMGREITDNVVGKLQKKEGDAVNEKLIERYNLNMPLKATIRKWIRKQYFPLPFLTTLFNNEEIKEIYLSCEGYTNCNHTTFIRFPRVVGEMLNPELFYLAGCIIGDGCLENESVVGIYDGYHSQDKLHYSKLFLENIQSIYGKIFCIPKDNISLFRVGNKYVLRAHNKWLTRFFNFFFMMPYGKKKSIFFKPFAILNLIENADEFGLKKRFFCGLFDADGHLHARARNISLVSQNKELLDSAKSFLIRQRVLVYGPQRIKNSWRINILVDSFKRFTEVIGFNHPRKKILQEKHLAMPFWLFEYHGIRKENLINSHYDLSKIPELRIYGAGNIFRRYRKSLGITTFEAANLLNISQSTISEWENNKKSMPLTKLFEISRVKEKDKLRLYRELISEDVRFKCSGSGGNAKRVRLPIKHRSNIEKLASIVRPNGEYMMHIKRKGITDIEKINNDLSSIFQINVNKNNKEYIIHSRIVKEFFSTFFQYTR